jgi:hypothetical protein
MSSTIIETRREQVNEYEKLVIRLWNSSASRPTDGRQIDDFLLAIREYRRFEENHPKPRLLTLGDISRDLPVTHGRG